MTRLAPLPLLLLLASLASAQPNVPRDASGALSAGALSAGAADGVVVPGRVIVKLASPSGDPVREAERLLSPLAGRFGRLAIRSWLRPELVRPSSGFGKVQDNRRGLHRIMLVEFSAPDDPRLVASKVATLDGIAYAEPEFRRFISAVPNDPLISRQWYLERIRAFDGWDEQTADSSMLLAIIDTGVDWLHPDLMAAIWRNPGEAGTDDGGRDRASNGVDDDANGFIDDWIGYDFAGRDGRSTDNDPSPGHWHGTHVAGIAAAVGGNGIGVVGVGFGARIMALKIADDDRAEPTLVNGYDALLYAVRMGANVINCSWGGGGRMSAEQDVIDAVIDAGALVVAAAGNDGRMSASFPASYRGVLSVASVADADKRSIFSNYNASVGISAPGSGVFSTLPTGQSQTGYGLSDGTSMASPMVAAAAALVRKRYPALDPGQVAAVLRASADNIDQQNPDYRLLLGSGRLNVLRALATGPNALMAGVESVDVVDATGDGIVEPGEEFELRIGVRNYLRPAGDVALAIAPAPGVAVTIVSPRDSLGALAAGESRLSTQLRAVAPVDAHFDELVAFQLTLSDGAAVIGSTRIEVTVNPNYATTTNQRISATFTGNGRIGFNDFPANEQGVGFRVGRSDNLLAEGGLLIGTSPSRLADVVRSGEVGFQSQGLQTVRPFRTRYSDDEGAEIGTAAFDDAHLHEIQRNGLRVDLTTYAYSTAGRDGQLLLFYRITNTSEVALEHLHCALYLDWDIGIAGLGNQTRLDPENRLGYTYNVYTAGLPFTGAMLVGDQPMNFYAADNSGDLLRGGFFQDEKWEAISSGIRRDESSIGDCSTVIGAGPITLAAGDDTTIVFSLMAGEDFASLRASATEARAIIARFGLPPGGPLVLPTTLGLIAGVPNPFTTSTRIDFTIPSPGNVTLDVFNVIGEHVATLANGSYPRGIHSVEFTPEPTTDNQVYFVRLVVGGETMLRKIVRTADGP